MFHYSFKAFVFVNLLVKMVELSFVEALLWQQLILLLNMHFLSHKISVITDKLFILS